MNLREKVFSSLAWKLLERAGMQSVSFIVSLILARVLTPSDYGLISLIIVFIIPLSKILTYDKNPSQTSGISMGG